MCMGASQPSTLYISRSGNCKCVKIICVYVCWWSVSLFFRGGKSYEGGEVGLTRGGSTIYIYIYIYLYSKVSARKACSETSRCLRVSGPLESALEPQMARNGRSSLPRSRKGLEMAVRACPGAAESSKWPFEHAPEPPNARKVLLENASIDMVAPLPLLAPGCFKFQARLLLRRLRRLCNASSDLLLPLRFKLQALLLLRRPRRLCGASSDLLLPLPLPLPLAVAAVAAAAAAGSRRPSAIVRRFR